MRNSVLLGIILLLPLFFFACATSVPVTVTKPSEINMAGNRVIAVLNFRPPEEDKKESEITGQLDRAVEMMKAVVDVTTDKKVMREYNRLLKVKKEQERLQEQLKET